MLPFAFERPGLDANHGILQTDGYAGFAEVYTRCGIVAPC